MDADSSVTRDNLEPRIQRDASTVETDLTKLLENFGQQPAVFEEQGSSLLVVAEYDVPRSDVQEEVHLMLDDLLPFANIIPQVTASCSTEKTTN